MWRVIYYTMAGCRTRDYQEDQEALAQAFYDRHIKKHPEYQDRNWSRTEIIHFANK